MSTNPLEQHNVFDLGNLNQLRKEALQAGSSSEESKAALKKAAAQFESIFTQMLLKSMRKANEAFEDEDSPFNTSGVKFFEEMHDQQLSTSLSQNGSLGLADLIVQQLSPEGSNMTPADALRQPSRPLSGSDKRVENVQSSTQVVDVTETAERSSSVFESAENFVSEVWDFAEQAAEKIGLHPAVMVAQAALETGWGKHIISKADGQSSHNLFNIKSDKRWQGDQAVKQTLEYEDGVAVKKQANFRVYDSIKHSFDDFIQFLQQNPRYQKALDNTDKPAAFLDSLQQAGYATDPQYANKIKRLLGGNELKGLATGLLKLGAD